MKALIRRYRGYPPVAEREATKAEAQLDLRDARIEALLTENAYLRRQLALAGLIAWYYQLSRGPLDDRFVPRRRWRHRRGMDDRTEVRPR